MLEDMVLGAVNQALDKGRETQSAEMGKLTGGMGGGMSGDVDGPIGRGSSFLVTGAR